MRIPSSEELKYALAEERAEKENVLDMLRDTNSLNAKLAKELEQAVHWMDAARDDVSALSEEIAELQDELAAARADLAVVRGERDTANARAETRR